MDPLDQDSKADGGLYERRTSLPRAIQLDLTQTRRVFCTTSSTSSYDPDDEVFIEFEEWQSGSSCISKHMEGTRRRRTSDVIDSLGPDSAWPEPSSGARRSTSPDIRQTLHVFTNDSTSQLTPRSDVGYWSESVTSTSSPLEPKWFRYSQGSDIQRPRSSTTSDGEDMNVSGDRKDDARVRKSDTVDAQPLETEPSTQQPSTPLRFELQSKEAFAPVAADSFEYNMNHPKRGVAVILNHETFRSKSLSPRFGSTQDVKVLQLLYKTLGFEVRDYHDLTSAQIYDTLHSLSQEDHSMSDCVCVTVLTHGLSEQHLYAYDNIYSYDDLYTHFTAPNCLTLAGKPKLFIIQACRGSKLDPGLRLVSSRTTTDSAPPSASYTIPSMSDFLIANSTFSDYYSWRNPEEGTWYIQSLTNILMACHPHMDLLSMLTRVACQVGTEFASFDDTRPDLSGMKQAPCLISTLMRQVYFRPKDQ